MRKQSRSWLAGIADYLRSTLSGLAGLLALIVLSILVVWPLWYLATRHTHLYSSAIMILAGGFTLFVIYAKTRHFFGSSGSRGRQDRGSGAAPPDPGEHRQ